MTKPLKHRIGFWLLISLIPAAILLFLNAAAYSFDSDTDPSLAVLSIWYAMLIAPAGLTLLIWGNVEFSRAYRASMQYAERHGWRPISRTAWRNRKADSASLAVNQAFQKRTFLLQIEANDETITIDEFETSLWALQFGDWLWSELLQHTTKINQATIDLKRAEWETTALAERSG